MGAIKPGVSIVGTIKPGVSIVGVIDAMSYDHYAGPYDVTPDVNPRLLKTKNLVMSDDVSVKAIPSYRVANVAGGDTFTIGAMNG